MVHHSPSWFGCRRLQQQTRWHVCHDHDGRLASEFSIASTFCYRSRVELSPPSSHSSPPTMRSAWWFLLFFFPLDNHHQLPPSRPATAYVSNYDEDLDIRPPTTRKRSVYPHDITSLDTYSNFVSKPRALELVTPPLLALGIRRRIVDRDIGAIDRHLTRPA